MLAYLRQSSKKINHGFILKTIIIFSVIVFFPTLFNFFSADDWFHLHLSQINSLQEFLNFFSFVSNDQSAAFYRPLPTQLFFFIFHSLFRLNAIPYYFFVLISFAFSLFLVYQLAFIMTKSKFQSLITLFVYGFSVTNFSRIYFLSAFQEIALVIFSLLTLIKFLQQRYFLAIIFFILALMSKETAVVLPLILFCMAVYQKQHRLQKLIPFFLILAIYLYLRLQVFGLAEGDTYVWNFSPKVAFNTGLWYVLWSFGAPELFADYVAGLTRIIPRFFTDYPFYSYFILIGLLWSLFLLTLNVLKNGVNKLSIFAAIWFLLTLLPVLFLPQHKFALELGLPLFGFALFLSQIIKFDFTGKLFLVAFLIFNLGINYLTYTRHYSTRRAVLSQRVYDYVLKNHHPCPTDKPFLFYNSGKTDYALDIELTISGPNMLKVVCNNKQIETFFSQPINPSYTIIPADIFFPI